MTKTSGKKGERLTGVFRFCIFLLLFGITIPVIAGCAPQQEVVLVSISYFKASPEVLHGVESANYQLKVNNAEEIKLSEAGIDLAQWYGPSSGPHTHKITFQGMPANAIPTEDGKFEATLVVSNKMGKLEKKLTLSVAAPAPATTGPAGATNNETVSGSYWGEQSILEVTSTEPAAQQPTTNVSSTPPQHAECPANCGYCKDPDVAAAEGFTEKCSDDPCYTYPDSNEKCYCYKEPEGWCCKNSQVSQSTKTACKQGGGYWSVSQSDAMQACRPLGWCCRNGNLYQSTQDECIQTGGSYWSTSQGEALQVCQPTCWCCVPGLRPGASGQVSQSTMEQCMSMGGSCYNNPAQAQQACQGALPPIGPDNPPSPWIDNPQPR